MTPPIPQSPLPEENSVKLTDDQQLDRYRAQDGWHNGIPEGHYAIPDPHDTDRVTMWRVKAGRLTSWPRQARNGPVLRAPRSEIPKGRAAREAFWSPRRAAYRTYLDRAREVLRAAPEEAAARYAAVMFRCASCNRVLRVPESNGYGIGPECRRWMPDDLLAEFARQVSIIRADMHRDAA